MLDSCLHYKCRPATLQPSWACRQQLSAHKWPGHEPFHCTAASCPVLHHTTLAPVLAALSNMAAEPATNQLNQQADQHQAASPHRCTYNHSILPQPLTTVQLTKTLNKHLYICWYCSYYCITVYPQVVTGRIEFLLITGLCIQICECTYKYIHQSLFKQ